MGILPRDSPFYPSYLDTVNRGIRYLEDIDALELGLDLAPRFATRYQGPSHEISSVYFTHEVSRSSIATPLYRRSADNNTV